MLPPFMITGFCLIDDWLDDQILCQRGPAPRMQVSEVLTINGNDMDEGEFYSPW